MIKMVQLECLSSYVMLSKDLQREKSKKKTLKQTERQTHTYIIDYVY